MSFLTLNKKEALEGVKRSHLAEAELIDLDLDLENCLKCERNRNWGHATGTYLLSRIPWFITINCCIQVTIYAVTTKCVNVYRKLLFIPARKNELWRILSYTLLHSDFSHLFLNVLLQLIVGPCLEMEQGHLKVGLVYLAGSASGSAATYLFQPNLSLLGASAGVYSLLMSHIPHLTKNFSELSNRYLRVIVFIILCCSDIGFSVFHFLINDNTNPRISIVAHIAGGLSGICIGFSIYRGFVTQW